MGKNDEELSVSSVTERRSGDRKCQDLPFALLFLLQLGGMIGLSIYYGIRDGSLEHFDLDEGDLLQSEAETFGPLLLGFGFLAAIFYLIIIRTCATVMVWFTLLLSVFGELALLIYYIAFSDSTESAVAMGIILGLNLLYIFVVRKRIAFAAACLEIAVTATKAYPAMIFMGIVGILMLMVWIVIWLVGASFAVDDITTSPDDNTGAELLYIFFFISFYWTTQVISNIIHVTVAGVMATWYFDYPHAPGSPTARSFKRAITTSLGPIALGSLLVAIFQFIRQTLHSIMEHENNFCCCCCNCVLWFIDKFLKYFNVYAFSQVAIYGLSYCEASKETIDLLIETNITPIINDDLVGNVLGFGSFFGGLWVFAVAIATKELFFEDMSNGDQALWMVVGFLIGFTLVSVVMKVVRSCIATLFVCFSLDKYALRETKPDEYEKLSNAAVYRFGLSKFEKMGGGSPPRPKKARNGEEP